MKRIRDLNIQFFRCCIVFFGFVALISILTLKTVSRDPVCKQKVTTSGTINPRWQKIARLKLQQDMDDHLSKSGLVMVQEISTGKILVATAASRQDRVVCDSPITEIVRPYEPGSVIKTLTIATALDQKVLTLRDTFYNTGSLKFGETELMNAVNLQKQQYTYQDMITKSINVGAVSAFQRLRVGDGQEAKKIWHNYLLNHFHFGAPYGLFDHEPAGYIPEVKSTISNDARYAYTSFGIGITASPVQITAAYSAILNNGLLIAPTLQHGQPKVIGRDVVSSQTSRIVREMLKTAAKTSNPTAMKNGYSIGGKSGTGPLSDAGGIYQYHKSSGTYVGFIGKDRPDFIMLVKLEEPEADVLAGVVAAKLWAKISQEAIRLYYE